MSSRKDVDALARLIGTRIAPHGGWDSLVAAAEAVLDAGYCSRPALLDALAVAKDEGAAEALAVAALEVRQAKSIPIATRVTIAAVLGGRARRLAATAPAPVDEEVISRVTETLFGPGGRFAKEASDD